MTVRFDAYQCRIGNLSRSYSIGERLMQHILPATDGSKSAARATAGAADLARAMGGRLSILTVGESLSEDVKRFARAEGSVADALEGFSDRLLQQARTAAEKVGVSAIHIQSGWGDPAEVIIEFAMQEKVDTIVVGRRGRGRLTGLLLGSVSQKLVSLAPCAVVVVP
jgi:nucleotide-binding universal stress UspA family protein